MLSGFLGSGKTTLLKNILENKQNFKVALIVNDMAELNIDAKYIKEGGNSLLQVEEKMVEMQNGCICCTLREDLLVEIKKLGEEGKYDYLVIESTGISEPLQVAETFTFTDRQTGRHLKHWAQLDTMVTVVDAFHFFDYIDSEKTVQDTQEAVNQEDDRRISRLLIEQIEFANVILLNKMDLVSKDQVEKIQTFLKSLNPTAEILTTTFSKVSLDKVIHTKKFNIKEAEKNPGWLKIMRDAPVIPESEEYGISSFVYKANRPFHDEKIDALLNLHTPLPLVLRSKGFAWIASFHNWGIEWNSTGRLYSLSIDVPWIAASTEDAERNSIREAMRQNGEWHKIYGDRRQEIVVIGLDLNPKKISKLLDDCLLTDEEMEWGPEVWEKKWQKTGPWAHLNDEIEEMRAEILEEEEEEEEE